MRLDLLLVRLRFIKSRTGAQKWIEQGHFRRNGIRVTKPGQLVAALDVLTLPMREHVSVIEILALPERRGPASEAQACYRELDADRSIAIADSERPGRETENEGISKS